jgi:hypothetical protein
MVPEIARPASVASDYFACIVGAGVPVGIASIFVSVMTVQGIKVWLLQKVAGTPAGGPPGVGFLASKLMSIYGRWVATNCIRFIRS